MTITTEKIRQLEAAFLGGMEDNFADAKGSLLRGSQWKLVRQDEADRLRSLMAQHKKFDRRLLSDIPKNNRIVLKGYDRTWWILGKKATGVAVASVLTPFEYFVTEGAQATNPPPIDSRELLDHVLSIGVAPNVSHVIGVCSPSGFTEDARKVSCDLGNITLVLIEPAQHGGWRVSCADRDIDPRLLELFDPEDISDKAHRVADHLKSRAADLATSGLSVSRIAKEMQLDPDVVRRGFELADEKDPELHLGSDEGELFLYRGVASEPKEKKSMSMIDRIRHLFSREGDENEKINELSQRRAALAQRRDRMYDEIAQLERRESDLVEQGKANKSQVARRRLAAQVSQLRKDIQRQNAAAGMLNKQIDILSTDIHNLTLIQQGQKAKLPTTEELTENAVAAEEMLESLNADADLVSHLETGLHESLTTDDELAILKEFEAADTAPTSEQPSQVQKEQPAISDSRTAQTQYEEEPQSTRIVDNQPEKNKPETPEAG